MHCHSEIRSAPTNPCIRGSAIALILIKSFDMLGLTKSRQSYSKMPGWRDLSSRRSVQAAGTCGPGHGVLQTDLGSGVGCADLALHGSLAWSPLSCDGIAADGEDSSCKSCHSNLRHLVLLLCLPQEPKPTQGKGPWIVLYQASQTALTGPCEAQVKEVCSALRCEHARALLPAVGVLRCRQPVGGLLTGWPEVVGTRWRK